MPDANYSASMNILEIAARVFYVNTLSTSGIRLICVSLAQNPQDNSIGVSIFR
jgi:hypothetical protein